MTALNSRRLLLIGGTDPSGAGLQTDWSVVHAMRVRASSVVSAVTVQNRHGVADNGVLPAAHLDEQLDAIRHQTFSAIKIGMLGNAAIIAVVLDFLQAIAEAERPAVILDPVLMASSGGELLDPAGQKALLEKLLPFTSLITPNIDELARLANTPINTHQDMLHAAQSLLERGAKAVLVKGGHWGCDTQYSSDLFISQTQHFYLHGTRWPDRHNVRGTGCALASGIAAAITQGYAMSDAIVIAKGLLSRAIQHALKLDNNLQLNIRTAESMQALFQIENLPKLSFNSATPPQYQFPSCGTQQLGIYPVVDSLEWIKKLLPLGIKTIQLRIKDKPDSEVENEISAAIDYAKKQGARLFINDYWRLAIKHRAYGIHLGQEDVESADLQAIADAGCRLGLSTHSFAEVARAHAIQPSYLALGPIFATTSKVMPWTPQGVTAVENWGRLLGKEYPLVAIGGINPQRARELRKTGVGSVAMISAITQANDYRKQTRELIKLFMHEPS